MNEQDEKTLAAALRSLGITEYDVERIDEPDDDQAHGLVVQARGPDVDQPATQLGWLRAGEPDRTSSNQGTLNATAIADLLQDEGFVVGTDGDTLAINAMGGILPRIHGIDDAHIRVNKRRDRIDVDLSKTTNFGDWLVFDDGKHCVASQPTLGTAERVIPRMRREPRIENVPDSDAELRQLLQSDEDPWLNEQVESLLSTYPAGMALAGVDLGEMAKARAIMTFLRYAEPTGEEREVLRSREIPSRYVDLDTRLKALVTINKQAFSDTVRGLSLDLHDHLLTRLNRQNAEEVTHEEWEATCGQRERLEIERRVLRRATGEDPLAGLIEDLDALGEQLVQLTSADAYPHRSELMRRVFVSGDLGWWTQTISF